MSQRETRFAVLLFTDIVGSTELKERHGVPAYSAALRIHNRHFERLARDCHLTILQNMGDGYFAEAGGIAEAVRFSLLFQAAMRDGPWSELCLTTRVGIRAGEVAEVDSAGGSGIVAPAADMAARVMSLAVGGQILLTRFVFDEARHFVREHPALEGSPAPPLVWLAHGPYLLKGCGEPVEIFEVGAEGLAPLAPPPDSEKAKRAIRPGEEETLGWRPATGLEIPGRPGWHLIELLGAGGFGEVWAGEHAKLRQRRAFKFCFDDERLRALKREVTLVRLLQSALGQRDDIVHLHELKLDEPPFYLESDLAPHGNLLQWAEKQGGLDQIPLERRIALVAHTATALAAAHSLGVLHKDIKPTNILIFDGPDGEPRPRLVDFGIGTLADPSVLGLHGVTAAGFTRATIQHSTGTPTYSPPEYLAGRPYTIQGDIYGLGVLLYQLVTAKPNEPLAPGWERDIADPLLREDIAECVDGDPARRFPSASQLAENLAALDARRSASESAERALQARQRAAYRKGVARATAIAAGIIALVAALAIASLIQAKRARSAEGAAETEKAKTQEALKKTEYQLERSQLEEGRTWLERARTAKEQGDHFTALMLAGRAVGFQGYGRRERESPEIEADYPLILGKPFTTDPALEQERPEEVARVRDFVDGVQPQFLPLWSSPVAMHHLSDVTSVAFSPDGTRIASASLDGSVKLWDIASGELISTLKGHVESASSVAFSPDGKRIVSGSDDMTVKLWDVATGKLVATLGGHRGKVSCVAFSPDGTRIASGADDKTAKVWKIASGELVASLKGHTEGVDSVAFSPDGTRIASASYDRSVKLWNIVSGELVASLEEHEHGVNSVAFSPDGTRIVSGSYDNTLRLWDIASCKRVFTMKGHADSVISVAFSPDGVRFASGSRDGTLKLWDAATGALVASLDLKGGGVNSVVFSPDGTQIASGLYNGTVKLLSAATGKPIVSPEESGGHSDSVTSVAFSPDGTHIVSGSNDKTVKLWDIVSGTIVTSLEGHSDSVTSVALSPDGSLIVSASEDKTLKLWDIGSGKMLASLEGHKESINSVTFSPDGKRIVSGSKDKTVKLWDTGSGKMVASLKGHTDAVNGVAFSPDGTRIVSGSDDKTVKLWDSASAKLVGSWEDGARVSGVAFSPDGTRIVSAAGDVKLRDAVTGMLLGSLPGNTKYYDSHSVAFSPDGRQIASEQRNGTVKIWNTVTGGPVGSLQGHCLAFSPDGIRIASASGNTVKLWAASPYRLTASLSGHEGDVTNLAFSPDGTTIVSTAQRDWAMGLWDIASGRRIASLGTNSPGHKVTFSPNGTRLASAWAGLDIWDSATSQRIATKDFPHPGTAGPTLAFINPNDVRIAYETESRIVNLWDMASGKSVVRPFSPRTGSSIAELNFSPDGARLAVGFGGYDMTILDGVSGQIIASITGYMGGSRMAFSPDGTRIAAAANGGVATIWDTTSGEPVTSLKGGERSSMVYNVTYSPDGTRIATASSHFRGENSIVRLWDTMSLGQVTSFMVASDNINSMVISPDGSLLATGNDKTVDLWDLTLGDIDLLHFLREGWIGLEGAEVVWKTNPNLHSETTFKPLHLRHDEIARLAAPGLDARERMTLHLQMLAKTGQWRAAIALWRELQTSDPDLAQHPALRRAYISLLLKSAESLTTNDPLRGLEQLLPEILKLLDREVLQDSKLFLSWVTCLNKMAIANHPALPDVISQFMAASSISQLEVAAEFMLRHSQNGSGDQAGLSSCLATFYASRPDSIRLLRSYVASIPGDSPEWVLTTDKLLSEPDATIGDFSDAFDRIISSNLSSNPADPFAESSQLPQSGARDAGDILHRAEIRFPQEEAVHRAIGWAFLGLDDPRSARAAFEKARSLAKPGEMPNTSLLAGISVASWLLEDQEQAIDSYRVLIEVGRAHGDGIDWADSDTLDSLGFDPRGLSAGAFFTYPFGKLELLDAIRTATLERHPRHVPKTNEGSDKGAGGGEERK